MDWLTYYSPHSDIVKTYEINSYSADFIGAMAAIQFEKETEKKYIEYKKLPLSEIGERLEEILMPSHDVNLENAREIYSLTKAFLKRQRFNDDRVPMAHSVKHYPIDAIALDLKARAIYNEQVFSPLERAFMIYKDVPSAIRLYVGTNKDVSYQLSEEEKVHFYECTEKLKEYMYNIDSIKASINSLLNPFEEIYELLNMSLVKEKTEIDWFIEGYKIKLLEEMICGMIQSKKVNFIEKNWIHYTTAALLQDIHSYHSEPQYEDFIEHALSINTPFSREIAMAAGVSDLLRKGTDSLNIRKAIKEKDTTFSFLMRYTRYPENEKKKAIQIAKAVLRAGSSQENLFTSMRFSNIFCLANNEVLSLDKITNVLGLLDSVVQENKQEADNYCIPFYYLPYQYVFNQYWQYKSSLIEN